MGRTGRGRSIAVALAAVAYLAPVATAAEVRPLLLTERFTPSLAPPANPVAVDLVALRGETEGFQLAVRSDVAARLTARVAAGSSPALAADARIVRIAFVNVARPSSGMSGRAGLYADPLPPQVAGGMGVSAGRWAGFAVLVDVPRAAAAGVHGGAVEIVDEAGTVIASQPFALRVSAIETLTADDPNAYRILMGFRQPTYRAGSPIDSSTPAGGRRVLAQQTSLFTFLADHHVTPADSGYASPNRTGAYPSHSACAKCWAIDALPRIGQYQQLPFRANVIPHNPPNYNLRQSWSTTGAAYLSNVWSFWQSKGWTTSPNSYVYAWDEPGGVTENTVLPGFMRMIHANAPGLKAFVTMTPTDVRPAKRLCKPFGDRKCIVYPGETHSNRLLWDGAGGDDVDAIGVPLQRYYGRYTSPLETRYKQDNSRITWNLLQQAKTTGHELWGQSYFLPTTGIPQTVIDAPGTDTRLLGWWGASEGNAGWFLWELARWTQPADRTSYRDPYATTLSYVTALGWRANGDVSLIYPPTAPQFGLNDPTAPPVSSLRFEGVEQGAEDADLITLARRAGKGAAVDAALKQVFGKVAVVPGRGYTFPQYANEGMPLRLETLRRSIIAALEQG